MAKVIPLNNLTRLNINPERVLDAAKGEVDRVVILGWAADGEEYFASSIADGADVLWLLERLKKRLLETVDE